MAQTEQISPLEPFEQNDELQLVAEVLRKDRKATAEFINRYADSVYCYVRRRVVPKIEVADDLVQETFLAAWQNLGTYRGQAPVRSWLLGIARHKVEDYYRRKMQEVELPEGALIGAVLSSANRDPRRFTDPDRFDLHRTDGAHLAFAIGTHFCLGAWFGRHLARVSLEILLDRLPNLRLDPVRPVELRGWEFRAPMSTWVRWDA